MAWRGLALDSDGVARLGRALTDVASSGSGGHSTIWLAHRHLGT